MEKYLLKYNVDGRLCAYLEFEKNGKVSSMLKIVGDDKLLRYDGRTKERNFTKYGCRCMLAHRFQASESWVTVVDTGCDIKNQYDFPKKNSEFRFDSNGFASAFTVSSELKSELASTIGIRV